MFGFIFLLPFQPLETSPAAYGTAFVLDPDTGIFDCGDVTDLPETDVVTMVVEAVNAGGADEATVVFTIVPVRTQSPFSPKKSIYYVVFLKKKYRMSPQLRMILLRLMSHSMRHQWQRMPYLSTTASQSQPPQLSRQSPMTQ